jgi:hypothetical protein
MIVAPESGTGKLETSTVKLNIIFSSEVFI